MKTRNFILGVLVGVIGSAVALVVAIALLAGRPVAKLPQPASAPAGDITVSVQEGYLGQLITEMARKAEPMIQAVVVDVRPNARVDMILGLQMAVLGQKLDLQLRLINSVRVEDARLRFDVQQMELAGLDISLDMLPQSMRTSLQTTVADANNQADRMLTESGLVPLGVVTDDSSITISLRAR
jgi:hypothetical protein